MTDKRKAAELGSGAAEKNTHCTNFSHRLQNRQPRRLPAYGRALLDAQRQGQNVAWLCLALDWELGQAFPRVVIPASTPAREIDLRLVRGLPCLVAHRGETSRAFDIAEAALMAGATVCPIFDFNTHTLTTTEEVMTARGGRAAA